MEKNKKVRLSILVDPVYHKILKMCCVELGTSIKDFVLKSVDKSIEDYTENKEKDKL